MNELYADVVVCGGGLGGTLAAWSAAKTGMKVILTESTDWIGGQLTSQAVPPDEHPYIEHCGCTSSYRAFRECVRNEYRRMPDFRSDLKEGNFDPASSQVSFLSHPPKLALKLLNVMLEPFVTNDDIRILLQTNLIAADVRGDRILSVVCCDGLQEYRIYGKIFIDGSDTGELIEKSGTEYRTGAESKKMTGEEHASDVYRPHDMQAFVYTAALEDCVTGNYTIEKPDGYDRFRKLKAPYGERPVYSMYGPDSSTGKAKKFGMYAGEKDVDGTPLFSLFEYRRIVCAKNFTSGDRRDVTLVNWPQNDWFYGNPYGSADAEKNLAEAKNFTLGFVYWLQTEAPRPDGGKGYPWLRLCGNALGTRDGLSKSPYIRESRRIVSEFTVTEPMVKKGGDAQFADSVGTGSYSIDLHITTQSNTFFYEPSELFTIPLGAMIPIRMKNLIPAAKNIGTTHITNGCYRVHPVEWNIGEVAGYLAAFAIDNRTTCGEVRSNKNLFRRFRALLSENGIEFDWRDVQKIKKAVKLPTGENV